MKKAAHSQAMHWLLGLPVLLFEHMVINTGIHIVDRALKLSFEERAWLGMGLKFTPTPIHVPENYLLEPIQRFQRNLQWKIVWHALQQKKPSKPSVLPQPHLLQPSKTPPAESAGTSHYIPRLYIRTNRTASEFRRELPNEHAKLLRHVNDMVDSLQCSILMKTAQLNNTLVQHGLITHFESKGLMNSSAETHQTQFQGQNLSNPQEPQQSIQTVISPSFAKDYHAYLDTAHFTPFLHHKFDFYRPNLSAAARRFFHSLRKREDLTIKPADKNLGLTIMTRAWYEKEAERQLSDQTVYKPLLSYNKTNIQKEMGGYCKRILANIKATLKNWHQEQGYGQLLCPASIKFLEKYYGTEIICMKEYSRSGPAAQDHQPPGPEPTTTFLPPSIYLLPKIHKPVIKGRPIVASHSWTTTGISRLVDYILQPFVQTLTTVLKDSKQLILTLEKTRFYEHGTGSQDEIHLLSADVESLYTNIDIEDGLAKLQTFLEQHITPKTIAKSASIVRQVVMELMELTLKNNLIAYHFGPHSHRQTRYYQQIQGTAMGTPAAVVFANIYMFMLENIVIQDQRFHSSILCYKRYLDDVFVIYRGDPTTFQSAMNSMHPKIKLNWTDSTRSCEFLDLIIYKGPRFYSEQHLMDLRVHQKTMNTYLYIPPRSFHTTSQLRNFISNELQRYIWNCSEVNTFITMKNVFYHRLRIRGYSPSFLQPLFDSSINTIVDYRTRPTLLARLANKEARSYLNTVCKPTCSYSICCPPSKDNAAAAASTAKKTTDNASFIVVPSNPHAHALRWYRLIRKHWTTLLAKQPLAQQVLSSAIPLVTFTKPGNLQNLLCSNSK